MTPVLCSYLTLDGEGEGGWGCGPGTWKGEDMILEDDEGLHDAGLVRVVHQGREGNGGTCGFGSHQGRAKHNAQITDAHLVILF